MAKTEELQMQHLTEEEIATRRAELRKMRDLMFRAEIKAKRISKIKSKAYRKIQKKERAKQAEKLKEMGLGVDEEADRMKMEVDRAKERATLKHKNNGKWAKSMRDRGELDDDQRKDMQEMYERGERLKMKIAGAGSSDEDSEDSDEDEHQNKMDDLMALSKDEPQPATLSGRGSGLMQMKFMKEAERRDQASNHDTVDAFREELSKLGLAQGSDEDDPIDHTQAGATRGRVSFNPGEKVHPSLNDYYIVLISHEQVPSASVAVRTTLQNDTDANMDNPWLNVTSVSTNKLSRAKNEVLVGKNSSAAALSKNALRKQQRKGLDAVSQAKDDSILEIDVNNVIHTSRPKPKTDKQKPKSLGAVQKRDVSRAQNTGPDEETSSDEASEKGATDERKHLSTAFEQRELVARAFAGDHVMNASLILPILMSF